MPHDGIDIHSHIVPKVFPPYAGKSQAVPWPSMVPAQAGHHHVMISGKIYRTVPDSCWSTSVRLEDMERMRIGRQVLSPMPELLSYWLPPEDATALLRHVNEEIAAMVREAPTRFSGLGGVPLQDVDMAIRELEYGVRELGLAGVEIATHINGVSIGAPQFQPFFSAAQDLGAAIFVHSVHPCGRDRLVGAGAVEQIVALPGDTALAIASLITGGTLDRAPNLRIAFGHGGGAFAMLLPRMEHAWNTMPTVKEAIPHAPRSYVKRLCFDSLVYDRQTLRHIIGVFGADRVCLGTDYPFQIYERDPSGSVERLELDQATTRMLRAGNAARFLDLPAA
jgi:aminocarboxymuconate-semialdehyde decarboxylase